MKRQSTLILKYCRLTIDNCFPSLAASGKCTRHKLEPLKIKRFNHTCFFRASVKRPRERETPFSGVKPETRSLTPHLNFVSDYTVQLNRSSMSFPWKLVSLMDWILSKWSSVSSNPKLLPLVIFSGKSCARIQNRKMPPFKIYVMGKMAIFSG